jgi:hypothetical protein
MAEELGPAAASAELERKLFRKGKFRFGVGIPGGYHSGIWSAWGNKNDYYLGARGTLWSLKVSLHRTLICRLAFTDKQVALLKEQGLNAPTDRALVKWQRLPAPVEDAVHVVSVIFPTDYLCLPAPEGRSTPILRFKAAPPGKAIEFGFFFSREAEATIEGKFIQIGTPLVRTTLDNGETVSIVAREMEFDRTAIPSGESGAGSLRFYDKTAFLDQGGELKNLTGILWNTPKDGESLHVIEISGIAAKYEGEMRVF